VAKAAPRSLAAPEPPTQYAALPWRNGEAGVEVLLITSRESRRWVIPKGWPIKGVGPGGSAAQEAFEEAGVTGKTRRRALGAYHYAKRLRSGGIQHVRVEVFALEVRAEHAEWPEKGERDKLWIAPARASGLVEEPELKALLLEFAP
jgi:8-oxo-dGTP pyrophosphatase MutT (NUDIX family)